MTKFEFKKNKKELVFAGFGLYFDGIELLAMNFACIFCDSECSFVVFGFNIAKKGFFLPAWELHFCKTNLYSIESCLKAVCRVLINVKSYVDCGKCGMRSDAKIFGWLKK